MKKVRSHGFTLLELLVVLAIVGAFTSLAYVRSQTKELQTKFELTQSRVALVQSALDSHLRRGCKSGVRIAPTIVDLVNNNYLESPNVATSPFDGSDFIIAVDWASYWQIVRMNLDNPDQAQAFLRAAGADRVDGSTLVWERGYRNHVEADSEGAKQFRAMFELNECD